MRRALPMLMLATLALLVAAPGVWAGEDDTLATAKAPPGVLHLRSHSVTVVINNGFATTEVDQTLSNPAQKDVEAQWSFPLPKDGSLSELAVSIGEEMVIGEVVAKADAQRIYAAEKGAGRDAGLMEQNGYFDYRVALARVPAGAEVHVRIVYFQPLDIENGVGRYLYPLQEGNTDDMNQSFWTMSKEVSGTFSIDATLKTAFPVDGLHSPSHAGFHAKQTNEDTWRGTWDANGVTLDRDFVLYYRLAPNVPAQVELLTYRRSGDAEGTFMAVVTPGADLAPITHGTDWIFVLDTSGSMKGEKIRTLQRGVSKALPGLARQDRFQLIAFSNTPRVVIGQWTDVSQTSVDDAARKIGSLQAGGGTNVFDALEMAYARLDADRPSAIVFVGDGVANTGPHEYRDFIEQVRRHDVRLFTFLIGNSGNERLLGDLATLSHGFAKSVSIQDELGAHLLLARERMTHEAMHGVNFSLEGATVRHPKTLPSLYLGQQLVVFGRYDKTGPSTLAVTAKISGEKKTWDVPVNLPEVDEANPELERLYGLAAIADLERESRLRTGTDSEARGAIVDMAIRYSLVTDYTSMIVVQRDRKDAYGIGDSNAKRRASERAAAAHRNTNGNAVQIAPGTNPLGGNQSAHAPSRAQRRSNGNGGGGGGGGGGSGALGPLAVLPLIGLAVLRRRRRKNAAR